MLSDLALSGHFLTLYGPVDPNGPLLDLLVFFHNYLFPETNQIAEVLHYTKHRTPGFISEGEINVYFYFPPYGNYETALRKFPVFCRLVVRFELGIQDARCP